MALFKFSFIAILTVFVFQRPEDVCKPVAVVLPPPPNRPPNPYLRLACPILPSLLHPFLAEQYHTKSAMQQEVALARRQAADLAVTATVTLPSEPLTGGMQCTAVVKSAFCCFFAPRRFCRRSGRCLR